MRKYIYIFLGSLCLTLGIIGAFLPVLPTTPFLLLAAWLFARSSKKLHLWLLNHKYWGGYIRDFVLHKSISLKAKIISIVMMWTTMLYTIIVVLREYLVWQILLLGIAIFVSIYILSFKTKRKK